MTKEIYLFSGLGADERVFQLLDFSGFSVHYIKWITPTESETIEDYATRLSKQIKSDNPTLLGLSFGGIMAVEVAKQIATKKVILIASAKTMFDIPFYYRYAGRIGLHKLLPTKLLKSSNFLSEWLFRADSSFEKQLLKQILTDTDPVFLKWAIDKIVNWKNKTRLPNIYHIHGTRDKILPLKFSNCDKIISKGGHLMTLNKAAEISLILRQQLTTK